MEPNRRTDRKSGWFGSGAFDLGNDAIKSPLLLVTLMALVVISFLVTTTVTQYHQTTIEGRVSDLVGNAVPSVETLSEARNHLHSLVENLDHLEEESLAARQTTVQIVLSGVSDFNASFRTYQSFPFFPNEREISEAIPLEMPLFEAEVHKQLALFQNGATRREKEIERRSVHERAGLLDRALFRVIEFNSAQSRRLGMEISTIRAQSLIISIILDAICVGLAILATFLFFRAVRAAAALTESRARELEFFSARVAHDLKNPLNALILASDQANRLSNDEKVTRFIKQIQTASSRMNGIIDGLFNFARSGAKPEKSDKADLTSAINAILEAILPDAKAVEVAIQYEPAKAPRFVACPAGVLDSILSNLIRNALKYIGGTAPPRRLILRVAIARRGHFTRVEVEDNGPGIEPGKEESIFEPYIRGNSTQPGLGLGLATVKRLVESYGGKVGVKSNFGHGSCFWFELPDAE